MKYQIKDQNLVIKLQDSIAEWEEEQRLANQRLQIYEQQHYERQRAFDRLCNK